MELLLQRDTGPGHPRTFGRILAEDGHRLCYTLEDEVREIPDVPVEQWKVKGSTAIPVGRYRVSLEHSNRFGPETLTLHGVPGFAYIRMHAGNTEADTEGCPLLGMEVDPHGIVGGTSRPAVELVKALVANAIACWEEVWLTVKNAEEAP